MKSCASLRLICAVFAATPTHLKHILSEEAKLNKLEHVITYFKHENPSSKFKIWTWEEFLEFGQAQLEKHGAEMEKRFDRYPGVIARAAAMGRAAAFVELAHHRADLDLHQSQPSPFDHLHRLQRGQRRNVEGG